MAKCKYCSHLVGKQHGSEGCEHCNCRYNWHGQHVKPNQFITNLSLWMQKNTPATPPKDDPPSWVSLIFYCAVAMIVAMGVLSGVIVSAPVIQENPTLYWFFIFLTIAVNLLAIGILQLSTQARFNRLKARLLDHEKRIKDLESTNEEKKEGGGNNLGKLKFDK